jgi:N-acetylmuramoyl-L-alanine amidase
MSKFTIIHDPGHGGYDSGAVGHGIKEKDIVLNFYKAMREELSKWDVNQRATRDNDVFISLRGRVEIANDLSRRGKCIFLSYHCNSASNSQAQGVEIFTSHGRTQSDEYATAIFDKYEEKDHFYGYRKDLEDGDPDKEAGFYVVRKTSCPALLIELGFISNVEDATLFQNPAWIKAVAESTVAGVREVARFPPTTPTFGAGHLLDESPVEDELDIVNVRGYLEEAQRNLTAAARILDK